MVLGHEKVVKITTKIVFLQRSADKRHTKKSRWEPASTNNSNGLERREGPVPRKMPAEHIRETSIAQHSQIRSNNPGIPTLLGPRAVISTGPSTSVLPSSPTSVLSMFGHELALTNALNALNANKALAAPPPHQIGLPPLADFLCSSNIPLPLGFPPISTAGTINLHALIPHLSQRELNSNHIAASQLSLLNPLLLQTINANHLNAQQAIFNGGPAHTAPMRPLNHLGLIAPAPSFAESIFGQEEVPPPGYGFNGMSLSMPMPPVRDLIPPV